VTIRGTYLADTTGVSFSGVAASPQVTKNGDNTENVTDPAAVPANGTCGFITVTTGGGTVHTTAVFTVTAGASPHGTANP
jgi:hypothetical protein